MHTSILVLPTSDTSVRGFEEWVGRGGEGMVTCWKQIELCRAEELEKNPRSWSVRRLTTLSPSAIPMLRWAALPTPEALFSTLVGEGAEKTP